MSDIGSVMGAVSPIVSLIPGVGQIAGPAIGALGSLLSVAGEKQEQQKKIISASPGRYGTGGDMPLSSDSFQVKGNPQTTDGNYYPQYNANLDHNEVVKENFVFSTKLKDPETKKPFSFLAKQIEASTGKAEKILKSNPNDKAAVNTIKHNELAIAGLKSKQETLAMLQGHRNPDGSTVQRQNGGPMAPIQPAQYQNPFSPFEVFTPATVNPSGKVEMPITPTPELLYKHIPTQQHLNLMDTNPNYESMKVKSTIKPFRSNATGGYVNNYQLGGPGDPPQLGPNNQYQLVSGDAASGIYFDPVSKSYIQRNPYTGGYTPTNPTATITRQYRAGDYTPAGAGPDMAPGSLRASTMLNAGVVYGAGYGAVASPFLGALTGAAHVG